MLFHPTTTVNVLRGETTDSLGDPTPGGTLVAEGVPAHITEVRKGTSIPSTDEPRVIRHYIGRLPGWAEVQVADRIEDVVTGNIYTLDSFTRPASFTGAGDLRMDLRRVS